MVDVTQMIYVAVNADVRAVIVKATHDTAEEELFNMVKPSACGAVYETIIKEVEDFVAEGVDGVTLTVAETVMLEVLEVLDI